MPTSLPRTAVASPPVLSVSALNQAVARTLETSFPLSWVAGEVSNFTRAASGHWYFTLKDEKAQVRAVMWRGRAQAAGFTPREGDKVEVRALVTLYAPRGDYQLSVEAIRRAGLGNLYEAFLRLKEKLEQEGLFAPERKRPLPAFVRTIGLVTSLQAAALRDVLTTLRRRAPHVQIILYPAPVQGEGAAERIAQAIRTAAARQECGLLLVCRGGGSMEDLWSFNHEEVARAIVASPMPVITGVGHETDFTIADFAADLRAPTPTAAAEIAARPHADWQDDLEDLALDLQRAFGRQLADRTQALDWLSRRLVGPTTYIAHERLRLQGLRKSLAQELRTPLEQARHALLQWRARLQAQAPEVRAQRLRLEDNWRCLQSAKRHLLHQQRQAAAALAAQLELLSPQRTLERGYAIVTDDKGRIARGPKSLQPRTTITLQMAQGSAQIGIASVQPTLEQSGGGK